MYILPTQPALRNATGSNIAAVGGHKRTSRDIRTGSIPMGGHIPMEFGNNATKPQRPSILRANFDIMG